MKGRYCLGKSFDGDLVTVLVHQLIYCAESMAAIFLEILFRIAIRGHVRTAPDCLIKDCWDHSFEYNNIKNDEDQEKLKHKTS